LLLPENHNRYSAACKILLIVDVLVGRRQNVEPRLLRRRRQFAVAELVPAFLRRCPDGVAFQVPTNRRRRCLIEIIRI
jgi:hypothetical protein